MIKATIKPAVELRRKPNNDLVTKTFDKNFERMSERNIEEKFGAF